MPIIDFINPCGVAITTASLHSVYQLIIVTSIAHNATGLS